MYNDVLELPDNGIAEVIQMACQEEAAPVGLSGEAYLSRALFERELRKVGVAIHYAMGAGDPSTPEGQVFIGEVDITTLSEKKLTQLRRDQNPALAVDS